MKYICLLATLLLFGCLKNESKSTPSPGTVERRPVFYGPVGHGLAVDGASIYAAYGGTYADGIIKPSSKWVVMRSSNAGASWSVVDYVHTQVTHYWVESLFVPSPGTILASGVADESWGVRISTDSGSSWASLPSISYPNTGANVSASRHARTRTGQRP